MSDDDKAQADRLRRHAAVLAARLVNEQAAKHRGEVRESLREVARKLARIGEVA